MEMVQTKLVILLICATQVSCVGPNFKWEKFEMDGHRTGVVAVAGDNVREALGVLDSVYTSPNGTVFSCGSTPAVAKAMIDVQPKLAYLKEIIGFAPQPMPKHKPESPLSNWAADAILLASQSVAHKNVDVGIINFGGIRIDMPVGNVLLDDIVSMFPFRNYVSVVEIEGKDLKYLLGKLAEHPQAVSGVEMVVKDKKLESVTVGGKAIADSRIYRVGTVDFLLDGGDGLYVARNAKSLLVSEMKVSDWMVSYVRALSAGGETINAKIDGRVTVK